MDIAEAARRSGLPASTLRFYEAKAAIVFCKTRVNVNHLMARMGNRGFKVVALSGELSQQERTNALSALRSGRANVCIATDVAARGIDLPGLELVIHADLPSNSETLLHRSGRTARAGSAGDVVTVVLPEQRRETDQLLKRANIAVRPQAVSAESSQVTNLVGEVAAYVRPAEVAIRASLKETDCDLIKSRIRSKAKKAA